MKKSVWNMFFGSSRAVTGRFLAGLAVLGLAVFILGGCAAREATVLPMVMLNATSPITTGHYRTVTVADMNNDGFPDFAGGSSEPGGVAVWNKQKSTNFLVPVMLPFKGDVRSIAAADLTGDGLKDIVCSVQRESSGIQVWLNTPAGVWKKGETPVTTDSYEGIVLADINNDGYYDIIAANATSNDDGGVQVWLGDGKGGWNPDSGPTQFGRFMDVAVADFNSDGALDIAAVGWGTYGSVKIWFGDGKGGWTPGQTLDRGNYYTVTAGDFTGNGHIDLLVGTYRQGVAVYVGNGQGEFRKIDGPVKTGSFWKALPVRFDGDRTGLLASSVERGGISAWMYSEGGDWQQIEEGFPTEGNYYDLAEADFDGDGTTVVLAASGGEGLKIFPLNPGDEVDVSGARAGGGPARWDGRDVSDVSENEVFTSVNGVPEYKIGVNDVLAIDLWDAEGLESKDVIVRTSGRISFGHIHNVPVVGLTPSMVEEDLLQRLSRYVREPQLDVTVKNFRSKAVTVTGPGSNTALNRQPGGGKVHLSGKTHLIEVLAGGGFLSDIADLKNINILRKDGSEVVKVDVFKAINVRDRTQNPVLDDGDVIFIPQLSGETASRVYVFGEVREPGIYSFSGATMSLFDAVMRAGGHTIFARPEETRVVRGDVNAPEILAANVKALVEQGDQRQNIELIDGDLVYVPRSAFGSVNVFLERIKPMLNIISVPARTIDDLPTRRRLRYDYWD